MLRSLQIKNYALIDSLSIDWDSQFNVITGETGAGKSILLGALSLVLGNRADIKSLNRKDKKCSVEATFDISDLDTNSFFQMHDLDYHDITIMRREITPSGRSRAFINDTPVTLQVMKSLGDQLIHLHTQHATLELMSKDFAIISLDRFASIDSKTYYEQFRKWQDLIKELNLLKEANARTTSEQDYFQFLLNELEEANLDEIQQQSLEDEMMSIENAEDIKLKSSEAVDLLEEQDGSIISKLNHVSALIGDLKRVDKDMAALDDRLNSTIIELQELSREIAYIQDKVNYDPQRLDEIKSVIDHLYRLQKKHQMDSVDDLISKRDEIASKLETLENSTHRVEELEKEISIKEEELRELASELLNERIKHKPDLEKTIENLLADLGMKHARFEVSVSEQKDLNKFGNCKVELLFNANKGGQLMSVSQVASGGELSRLMLAIKSILAGKMVLPTLIFDEIDTGISGEIAIRMGDVLKQLSSRHQLICITHLPQIAGKGNAHYYIYKSIIDEKSVTRMTKLDGKKRIETLAEMIGGEKAGDVARKQAKELLHS
ncbi:MAG: DNA repair protein RecN [Chitinophagales bacterium]|nr:DNA repair protein RecN [Chitinophagales bacterium]